MQWHAFWLPKGGHAVGEYEDAFACSAEGVEPCRAAVADGATEAAFSGRWAQRLVQGFVEERADALDEGLSAHQRAWAADVEGQGARPWYVAEKVRAGAFAAVLGLELFETGRWRAWAVGDTCLFHLRGGVERLRWPITAPEAFGHRPALVPSRAERPLPDVQQQEGTWRPGDAFLLATDALAAWLMHAGPAVALDLNEDMYSETIHAARASGALRNDDVTLLVVEIIQAVP